jgi:hypothetical protein
MAQLDIKNADVFIEDGYAGSVTGTTLVNNMSGYMSGATVMAVDGSTGAVTTGDRFSVAGDTTTSHTVTAHTETLGNTTQITFTPALGASVADNAIITWLPHRLQIRIGEGNLQWTEKRNIMYTKDRGRLDTVKLGDEEPVEVKLDFTWVFLKSDTGQTPTVEDVLKKRGEASSWVTSAADMCEPYAVDIKIVYTPPCASEKREVYLVRDFRYEDLGHDVKQGMVSVSGKANITEPTVTRTDSVVSLA